MTNFQELLTKRNEINAAIYKLHQDEKDKAITEIRKLIAEFGITASDLQPAKKVTDRRLLPVPVKFADPQSGLTWSGRGKTPRWLDGKNRDQYLVPSAEMSAKQDSSNPSTH